MVILLFFAFISGIITILSPCILPILPVILAGGVGGKKNRSLGIVLGFVVSFSFFTLALTAIAQTFGISPDILRFAAVVIIISFGLVLLIPKFHEWFGVLATRIASLGRGKRQPDDQPLTNEGLRGLVSGLPVGFSLGLVWTPCVGPIMASVITLALTQSLDNGAILITLAYALGTAIPMLIIMLTGRTLLKRVPFLLRHTEKIQKIFGVLMIVIGISIGFNWDRQFQSALLRVFPDYGTGLTALENTQVVQDLLEERENESIVPRMMDNQPPDINGTIEFSSSNQPENGILYDYGKAPDIVTPGPWFNTSNPFTMDDLLGKVVLVDFWTYSCINCIRTIPHLKSWYNTYKDDGFVIIGVHTPEFEFEKSIDNVQKALKNLNIDWPVVLDNEFKQWKSYSNRYWPAHYFIDAHGHIRYFHFGEGQYETSENVIHELLKEAGKEVEARGVVKEFMNESKTPEIYLGYGRGKGFVSDVPIVNNIPVNYVHANVSENGKWTLDGKWTITKDYIIPEDRGILELTFYAKNVYIVVEPEEPGSSIIVHLDGVKILKTSDLNDGTLIPDESRLYELVNLHDTGLHHINLDINGRIKLFAFTFG